MFNSNNVSATFTLNDDSSKKAIGTGILNLAGIQILYSAYASGYKPSGLLVSLPSKALYNEGRPVVGQNGRTVYESLVSVVDPDIQPYIDEAIINAMANKGIYLSTHVEQAEQAGAVVTKVIEVPASTSRSFSNPNTTSTITPNTKNNSFSNTFSETPSVSQETVATHTQQSAQTVKKNHLPF